MNNEIANIVKGLNAALKSYDLKVDKWLKVGPVGLYIESERARFGRTPRRQIKFGNYDIGPRKFHFREGKNGFRFEAIAEKLAALVAAELEREALRKHRASRRALAERVAEGIRAEFPGLHIGNVGPGRHDDLSVNIETRCTPDQARQLLAAALAVQTAREAGGKE